MDNRNSEERPFGGDWEPILPFTDTIVDKLTSRRYSTLPAAQGTMMLMVEVTGLLVTRDERRLSGGSFGCMPGPGTRCAICFVVCWDPTENVK